jgi:hypothetical protein
MRNLTPTESLALAFVLGAGIGSILHFFFMLFLLTVRRFRCGKADRRARREARRQARRQRKEARRALEGRVRLGEVADADIKEAEVLPAYDEGETGRLVEEKA